MSTATYPGFKVKSPADPRHLTDFEKQILQEFLADNWDKFLKHLEKIELDSTAAVALFAQLNEKLIN